MVENASVRALRLLDLVPYLTSHPGVSITKIAKEFEISRAEVIKDLNLIFLCGLPGYTPLELIDIAFDDESVSVYDPQNLGVPRRLTESEALSLRIALHALADVLPENHKDRAALKSLIEKISSIFQSEIPQGALTYKSDKEQINLSRINRAIADNKQISMSYFNKSKDERKIRVVDPVLLIVESGRASLQAWCHTSGGLRTFALENIESAEVLESQRLKVDAEGDFEAKYAKVNWIGSNRSFLKKYPSIQENGTEIPFFQNEWLIRSAFSYFDDFELEEPKSLRGEILKRCKSALELYAGK